MSDFDASLTWAKPTPEVPAVERDPWRLLPESLPEAGTGSGPARSALAKFTAVPAKPVFPPHPPPVPAVSSLASSVLDSLGLAAPAHTSRSLSPEPAEVALPGPSLDLELPCSSPVKMGGLKETDSQHPGLGFQPVHDATRYVCLLTFVWLFRSMRATYFTPVACRLAAACSQRVGKTFSNGPPLCVSPLEEAPGAPEPVCVLGLASLHSPLLIGE